MTKASRQIRKEKNGRKADVINERGREDEKEMRKKMKRPEDGKRERVSIPRDSPLGVGGEIRKED